MADLIRLGRVSSIDYETGQIAVMYTDRDDSVTSMIPYLTFNNEYHMPKPEDYVAVMHLSTGAEMAIVLGTYWDEENLPAETGKDLYLKEFSNTPGKAYMKHEPSDGELEIRADKIRLVTEAGSVSVAQIIEHIVNA